MTRDVRRIARAPETAALCPRASGCGRAVRDLVVRHLLQDRAAAPIGRRQAVQVIAQVRFDLALGFGDEAEAGAIAASAATAPMANEPAYHKGFSTLGRPFSS